MLQKEVGESNQLLWCTFFSSIRRSNLIVSAFFIMDMNVVPSCLADFHSYLLTQDLRPCDCRPNCLTTQQANQNGAIQLFNKSINGHSTEREITNEPLIPSDLFPVRILLIHASLYSSASFCLSVYFWCCRVESVRKYNLHRCSFLFNTSGVLRRFEKPHRKVHFKIELCVAESTLRSKGSMSLTLHKINELSCGWIGTLLCANLLVVWCCCAEYCEERY